MHAAPAPAQLKARNRNPPIIRSFDAYLTDKLSQITNNAGKGNGLEYVRVCACVQPLCDWELELDDFQCMDRKTNV